MGKRKRRIKKQSQSDQTVSERSFERLASLLPEGERAQLAEAMQKPLMPAIRINPLKCQDPQSELNALSERYAWQTRPVPFCSSGWWVTDHETTPGKTFEHRLGQYYIQDAASMLPVELFDLDDLNDPLILDLAASPGGKTTHLVSRTADRGLVIANDSSRARITALRLVLRNWGAAKTAVTQFPGEQFGTWFPETFDRVLLDAPCSMESLHSTDSHTSRPITPRERGSLARRQTHLLESALQAVREGGQVVYATCTLSPEEDEAVLDNVLRRFPRAVRIENIASGLPIVAPGLSPEALAGFLNLDELPNAQVTNAIRLWPHIGETSGFFAALLTRCGPLPVKTDPPPSRPLSEKTGLIPLQGQAYRHLIQEMQENFGFDLEAILEQENLSVWQRGDAIHALPETFLNRFESLPFKSLGLPVGQYTPGGFIPDFDWLARFEFAFTAPRLTLPDALATAWLNGEDLRETDTSGFSTGQVVVMADGNNRLLGHGRLLPDRIKNLLPRRAIL
jgi:16S rRNA (cytosine1407-C5)-methyltransferase